MSNTTSPKSYPYKPKRLIMLLCIILFGLASWFFAEMAFTSDRGLNLILYRHVLEFSFSPSEAAICHWVLSVVSAAMSLLGLFGLYMALTSKAQLILTTKEISIPSGLFKPNKSVTIPFSEILSLEVHKVNNIRFLKIIHPKGKTQVNDSLLPEKIMFDEIFERLKDKSEVS